LKNLLLILAILIFGHFGVAENLIPAGGEVSFIAKPGLFKRCAAFMAFKQAPPVQQINLHVIRAVNIGDLEQLVGTKTKVNFLHDHPNIIPPKYKYIDYTRIIGGFAGPVYYEPATYRKTISEERIESTRRIFQGTNAIPFAAYEWWNDAQVSGYIDKDDKDNYVIVDEKANTRSLSNFIKNPGTLFLIVTSVQNLP